MSSMSSITRVHVLGCTRATLRVAVPSQLVSCRTHRPRGVAASSGLTGCTLGAECRKSVQRKALHVCCAATASIPLPPPENRKFELIHGWRTDNLKGDFYGGLTAAVVALPLALAFGVASGAGALAGLYGSIFVGFFAALFGGTPSQVSGPTGPMTVVTAAVITQFAGQFEIVAAVIVLAGVFQILMGLLRLGQLVRLVPVAVTSGFMTGIGCIIISTQSLALCGLKAAPNAVEAVKAWPKLAEHANPHALALGMLSFIIAMFAPSQLASFVPRSLLALLAGTAASIALGWDVPLLGEIPSGLPLPTLPNVPTEVWPAVASAAFVLALLGAIDSLLTSLVADNITNTFHDSDRELVGQGLGNAVAGLFGGVPGAGATMRTVINVRAGGRSPLSGALHAVIILFVVLGLGRFAKYIPIPVLAGILLKSGVDVMDYKYMAKIPQLPFESVFVMAVTLALTVFFDLIQAVAVGCMLSALLLTKRMADFIVDNSKLQRNGDIGIFAFSGPFTFPAANGVVRKLTPELQSGRSIVLDMRAVAFMDSTATLTLEELLEKAQAAGARLLMCDANEAVRSQLAQLGLLQKLNNDPTRPYSEVIVIAAQPPAASI